MEKWILQDIISYLKIYNQNAIVAGIFFTTGKLALETVYGYLWRRNRKGLPWYYLLSSTLVDFTAGFYAYMVFAITFFSRMEGSIQVVNLKLFSTFVQNPWHMRLIVENFIMFIPLGIYLRWYGVKGYRFAVPLFACMSVGIEIAQYVTKRGKLEVDDVLTNTAGGIVGFTVMCLVINTLRRVRRRK